MLRLVHAEERTELNCSIERLVGVRILIRFMLHPVDDVACVERLVRHRNISKDLHAMILISFYPSKSWCVKQNHSPD